MTIIAKPDPSLLSVSPHALVAPDAPDSHHNGHCKYSTELDMTEEGYIAQSTGAIGHQ